MEAVFLKLVNLSIAAGWLVLAVMVLRLVLRKAPKWIFCLLWALVALRLVCPVSIESALSLIPSAQTLPPEILYTAAPQINSGIPAINSAVNPVLDQSMTPVPGASVNPTQVWSFLLSCVWIAGVAIMALYALVSYWLIKRRVATATLLRENIKQSEYVDSPFVLGLFRPVIYLPYGMAEDDRAYVVAHERAHIRRKDHWWKPLGFLLLSVYWFNPLLWIAYVLLCRDIEGACDEKVIREMGLEDRRGYSTALFHCSVHRRSIAACPLAFGEVGVKERITSVMNYKRPAFWLVAAALAACVAAAVCFLTNPPVSREFPMNGTNIADLDPQEIVDHIAEIEKLEDPSQLSVNGDNFELSLTRDFQWKDSGTVRFFYYQPSDQGIYSAQLRIFPDEGNYFVTESAQWPEQDSYFKFQTYLEALKYLPQEVIREYAPDAKGYCVYQVKDKTPVNEAHVWTYTADGLETIDGWSIHLAVVPNYGGSEATPAEEVLHFLYGEASDAPAVTKWFDYATSSEVDWEKELTTQVPQFPGVTFRYTPGQITAVSEAEWQLRPLITGMPIWNAYFCDLTGDGLPELCSTFSWGSGIVDIRVVIYDYANGASYMLEDRGRYDYCLRYEETDGFLYVDKRSYMKRQKFMNDTLVSSHRLAYVDGSIQLLDVGADAGTSFTQQTEIVPGDYDFNHDGVPEVVELTANRMEYTCYELLVTEQNGTELWRGEAYPVHPGYNSIFACRLEDGDYLLQYHPTMYQGFATYAYELFSLDKSGNPVTKQENSVSFDVNWGTPLHESFDGEAIADFMDELNGLLAQSKLLVTTDEALEGIDPDHPQDNLWWLQHGDFTYDENLSLRENLLALEQFIGE